MTGLLKCVAFSCLVSLAYGLTSVRDDVNWFKNGQRIKNRFVTGVVNGIVDLDCNDVEGGENAEGVCMSKLECTKTGGKVGGLCSLLGSCCVIKRTCHETTSAKLSYFVPPKTFTEDCPLTINVYSKDVSQIRLDFEKFDIAQPTNKVIHVENENETIEEAYKCHDDAFKVENVQKSLGFVHLCGKNDGQHIYIPVGENQQKVVLRFTFRSRNTTGNNLPQPVWKIKIRQLEGRRTSYEQLLTAPSKLMAMYNTLKNKKNPKPDYDWIAPDNCLQYYPNSTGTFESFNYNGGKGCYIGNLHYAICFRKTPDICRATYTVDGVFQMNYNPWDNDTKDQCHPEKPASSKISQDYIQIPGAVNAGNYHQEYYCDSHFRNNNTVTAKPFGPLYVGVHTDGFRPHVKEDPQENEDHAEVGFRIRYNLHSGNCDSQF